MNNKVSIDDSDLYCHLTHTKPPHNKFYKIYITQVSSNNYRLQTCHGKIGTDGIWLIKAEAKTLSEIQIHAKTLESIKKNKGYVSQVINKTKDIKLILFMNKGTTLIEVKKVPITIRKHSIWNDRLAVCED